MEIVMKNNIIKFGDVYRKRISGTAMVKPLALHLGLKSTYNGIQEDEYTAVFLIGKHVLKLSSVSLMIDVRFGT